MRREGLIALPETSASAARRTRELAGGQKRGRPGGLVRWAVTTRPPSQELVNARIQTHTLTGEQLADLAVERCRRSGPVAKPALGTGAARRSQRSDLA